MEDRDVDELQRIWELKQKGAITDDEYQRVKQRILENKEGGFTPDTGIGRPPLVRAPSPPKTTSTSNISYQKVAGWVCVALFVLIAVIGGSKDLGRADNTTNSELAQTTSGGAAAPDGLAEMPARERAARTAKLLGELKKVPESNLQRKHELYSELADLNPDLQKYASKRNEYASKIDAAKPADPRDADALEANYLQNPQEALTLTNFSWTKEGFGTVLSVSFTVRNAAGFAIKDFNVKCNHYAPSGTQIDENSRTIYDVVPAHGAKTIRNFGMGFVAAQAATTSCSVIGASRA